MTDYETQGFYAVNRPLSIEHKSEWTPFVGVTYDIDENNSVYASYTDIFKPQRERSVTGEYLDPVEGKNYEIGVKSTNDAQTQQSQFSVFKMSKIIWHKLMSEILYLTQ